MERAATIPPRRTEPVSVGLWASPTSYCLSSPVLHGHSTTSSAASTVLGALFPDQARELAAMAYEAAISRLYGGIHYSFDNDAGLDLGRRIGAVTLRRLGR